MPEWTLREGRPDDVPRAMAMLRTSPWLTCHTEHTYWILFNYGRRYVVIAEVNDRGPIGFISGVRSTCDPQLMFVWQLVVDPDYRGSRLAWDLLYELTERIGAEDGCTYWQTAIDVENKPLMSSLMKWHDRMDRVGAPHERITYETPGPDGKMRTVSEVVFVFRRKTDPLAAGLGRGPEDWKL
jgi:GNAT superfamily N-acetyltransferase